MNRRLASEGFLARVGELGGRSDLMWFVALNVGLAFTLVAAYVVPFSAEGKFWAYAGLFIRASCYLWAGEALRGRGGEVLDRLFRLGLVAGAFELLVDWGLIHWIERGRLVYLTGNDVVLLGSPVWMPLAWACVIVELGYPAVRLFGWFARRASIGAAALWASLIAAALAGVTVGFYEYFAYRASWWKYEPANAMIGEFCALYIPLGEFLMFLPVLFIVAPALEGERRSVARLIVAGIQFAICIAIGYALAWLLLEGRA